MDPTSKSLSVARLKAAQLRKDMDNVLRAAVRDFATSIGARRSRSDMSLLISATDALPLSQLAHWERSIRDELRFEEHPGSSWMSWLFGARPSHWMDLTSWGGHIRERALRTISGPAPNSFLFALAIRRLNDWVPQVRRAAREKIPLLASASNPEHVADALCALLPIWTSWGRLESLEKKALNELVFIHQVADAMRRRITSATTGPMAIVLSQTLRTSDLDKHLMEIATGALQPAVRAVAYRTLLTGKAIWIEGRRWQWTDVRYCEGNWQNALGERSLLLTTPFRETLESAATDSSSIVRRVAAEMLIREINTLGIAAIPLARQFAADNSAPVAERGAFALQRMGIGRG